MTNLYSTVELSRLLGIQEHRITYAMRAGYIPEPSFKIANKRVFTDDNLRRIAEYFGVQPPAGATERGPNE